jgi:hypothetical protein
LGPTTTFSDFSLLPSTSSLRKKFAIRQQKGKQQQQQQQQQQPSSATLGFYLLSHQTKNGKTHSQNPSNCNNNNNNKTKPTSVIRSVCDFGCVYRYLPYYLPTYLLTYLPTYLPIHVMRLLVDISLLVQMNKQNSNRHVSTKKKKKKASDHESYGRLK